MPHLIVKCYAGKTEEQKKLLAQKLTAAVTEVFACPEGAVSVGIEDYDPSEWKQVWEEEIGPKMDKLYKQPGYSLD
ncbi:MAG: tautomerase family protein [Eubacteriales bacterium]|nr:tautomerase family protein [Eubacteriales bacterium]